MNHRKPFQVPPGSKVRLRSIDPGGTGKHDDKQRALDEIDALREHMDTLQVQLYAERKHSLLIVLQGLDAGGKDGVIRHVATSLNPQGCRVASFKEPTGEELAHDFLWRIEAQTPKRGEIVIFNRSHYEDVLIVRVHELVKEKVWSQRFDQINDFERRLADNDTTILKFFLHISPQEQLKRFEQRLDDPDKRWKISEADYSERELWGEYVEAYEEVFRRCSTKLAPWFIIPANHKWYRNLAISRIIVETLEKLGIEPPTPTVDIEDIRAKYHQEVRKEKGKEKTKEKDKEKRTDKRRR